MARTLLTFFVITGITFLLGRLSGNFWHRRAAKRAGPVSSGDALVQCRNCQTDLSKGNMLEAKREGAADYFCGAECTAAFEKKRQSVN